MVRLEQLTQAGTATCTALPIAIAGRVVLLVDTPGFDDTYRSDAEILSEISKMLIAQHKLGVRLKGVVYLHRISDDRLAGSSMKTLKLFKQICGEKAFSSVLLVTTRWDKVGSEELGAAHERELSRGVWQDMMRSGANMARFYGDRESAQTIINQLVVTSSVVGVVLQIQDELLHQGKRLHETKAGAAVSDEIANLKMQMQEELQALEQERRRMDIDDRERRRLEHRMHAEQQKLEAKLLEERRLHEDLRAQVERMLKEGQPAAEQKVKQSKGRRFGKLATSIALKVVPAIALELLGMFVGIPGLGSSVGMSF